MSLRELIFYAAPTGALARLCDTYFDQACQIGPTTAQTYPPHCTITGFFRCPYHETALTSLNKAITTTPSATAGQVTVGAPMISNEWVGLTLESPWIIAVGQQFKSMQDSRPDTHPSDTHHEDPVRLKTWLHLSQAYGVDDLQPYGILADEVFEVEALRVAAIDALWDLAIWERSASGWIRLRE